MNQQIATKNCPLRSMIYVDIPLVFFCVFLFNRYVELPEGMIWFSPWNNTVHWHTLQETTVLSVTYRGVRLKVFLNRGTFDTTKHVVSWNVVSPMKLLDTDLTYQKKHVLTYGVVKNYRTKNSNCCSSYSQFEYMPKLWPETNNLLCSHYIVPSYTIVP